MASTRFAVLVAAVLVACAAPAATLAPPGPMASSTAPPQSSTRPSATAVAGMVIASISLPHAVAGIAADAHGVWLRALDGHVLRVDPATNRITADVEVKPSEFGDIKIGAGSVWVTDFDHDTLLRVDAAAAKIVKSITVGPNPEWLTVTPETVWVSNHRGGSISKVDVASNTVAATYTFAPTGPSGPRGIILLDGAMWTSAANSSSVYQLDLKSGSVIKQLLIPKGNIHSLLTDGRFLYLPAGGSLTQIDPKTSSVIKELHPQTFPMVFARSTFWSVSGRGLVRLDPDTFASAASWQLVADTEPKLDVWGIASDNVDFWVLGNQETLLRVAIPE